jgi:3-phenylpropionate/trans-cinnamate dioxygenase ferredoxin reductase subunit
MHGALCRLALFPNVTIIPTVSEPQNVSPAIRIGRPTDHLPNLSPNDVVYTSGAPAMTESVARIARAAGARCYTDPFVSNAKAVEQTTLMARVANWLNNGPRNRPIILRPAQKPVRAVRARSAVRSATVAGALNT